MRPTTQLRRSPTNRRIAGVAGGLSDFFGIDATLIRVAFVLGVLFTSGAGLLIYGLAWVLIPQGQQTYQAAQAYQIPNQPKRHGGWKAVGIAGVFFGGFMVLANGDLGGLLRLAEAMIVPVVVVVVALLLWRRFRLRKSWRSHKEFEQARLAWQRRIDEQRSQVAPPTYLGGNPFQIDSFYSAPPPTYSPPQAAQNPPFLNPGGMTDPDQHNPNSGFQIQ